MKKKTLRQQLMLARIIIVPRTKRTSSSYMKIMEKEGNQRMFRALSTLC